ncbi:MAG: hypothetical protein LBF28_03360 [Rickettsiales bacterium]|jgi:hypothetical protein|nr:hypothetical protein [Rickettsiales bacterium]
MAIPQQIRFSEMKQTRQEWDAKREIFSEYLAVQNGIFNKDLAFNKNKWRDLYAKKNINGNPQRYLRNLSTCLTATLCPPDSKWASLVADDQTRDEQIWLKDATEKVLSTINAANGSEYFTHMFFESPVFGEGVIAVNPSKTKDIDFVAYTAGTVWLDENDEGDYDTIYIATAMNARQLAKRFGYDNLPDKIKNACDKVFTECYTIVQAVEPNEKYLPEVKNEFNTPYISTIFLDGFSDNECILEQKGMKRFRFAIFPWYKSFNSVYNAGIGGDVIGDVMDLQARERDLSMASRIKVKPPLVVDKDLKNAGLSLTGDKLNWVKDPTNAVRPALAFNLDTTDAKDNIARIEQRIYNLTYNHLFNAITNRNKTMSATEVNQVSKEEMINLVGIVQRAVSALGHVVELVFQILYEKGKLPPNMPESLRGKIVNVKFHSLLAQSQSLSDLVLVERWIQAVAVLSNVNPIAKRKIDILEVADEFARRLDINGRMVVPTEEILRQQLEEMEAMRQQSAAAQQAQGLVEMSEAAKNFASAETIAQQAMI